VKIEGDPRSPISLGYICPKGVAHRERLYHPDRLTHPLLRVGKRGEGRWKRIGWDEALGVLSERMLEARARSGPQSVLFAQGAPKGLEFFLLLRLANVFGSPNVVGPQNVCHMPREIAANLTVGFWPEVDYEHPPRCIVLWGSNLDHTNEEGTIRSRLRRALKRGSRLIVVDPRPTPAARRAEVWLRLRPGTDAALALGMMRVILEEGLEDRNFVQEWTVGSERLKMRLESYPLSRVEEITWVPQDEIRRAARIYAGERPSAIQWGNALEHNLNSHQNCRAVLVLMALTGNLEVPGGNFRATPPPCMPLREMVLPQRIEDRPRKMLSAHWGLHPMLATVPPPAAVETLRSGSPHPVEVLYIQGSNPLITYPHSQVVKEALQQVPFLAVAELMMTPTALLADLVLPAATNFEYDDIGHYGLPHGFLVARPKIVDPPGEAWPDIRILNELAKILGFRASFWEDEREILDAVLEPAGMDYEAFKKRGVLRGPREFLRYGKEGFRTPSGKVEIYSSRLEARGLDPLPNYRDPLEPWGGLCKEFPLILTSAKDPVFFHSAGRRLPMLRKVSASPRVELAPELARSLSLGEGEWVWIVTPTGRIRQRVHLSPGMDPRVVSASYGWWFPERGEASLFGWNESNLNLLTDFGRGVDPLVGSTNLRCLPCRLESIP